MPHLSLSRALTLSLLVAAASGACSASPATPSGAGSGGGNTSGGGGSANPATDTLEIAPIDAIVGIGGGLPGTQAYTVKLVSPDSMLDVTADATFSVTDPSLGVFEGATFKAAGIPGKSKVNVSARGLTAQTPIAVHNQQVILTPGVPADSSTLFGGEIDANKTPELVYPSDGTMMPPNMNLLEIQFRPGVGNTLFELMFSSDVLDLKIYITCSPLADGCVYTPDAAAWKAISDGGRGTDPLTYTLRGVDSAAPGAIGVSKAQTISFGQEDIIGGLYYWNAAAGATMRYEFGVTGKQAELYLNAPTAGAGFCVGCHVLSRDGKKIAVGLDIPAPAVYKVFDVATKGQDYPAPGTAGGASNFFTFSPDAKQLMTSNGASIVLRDTATGVAITEPLVANGTMPDWSPDGKKLVYARPNMMIPFGTPGIDKAQIETLDFDGTTWSPATVIVPYGGQNNYYPAFSPEGNWVVFNRSPSNQNSMDAKDAQVWVSPVGGGGPIHLAKASTGGDSWPKWTPNLQVYKGGSLLWLTFSSRRPYGLRKPGAGDPAQIWMTAFDPAKAKLGEDPSYPAFWLPFQDLASGNHIAQWVTSIERKPCFDQSECESGEICVDGICVPDVPK